MHVFQKPFDYFNTEFLFIRPDSGLKTFTGFTIWKKDFNHETNFLKKFLNPETLIIVAPVKTIIAEYRFVIGNGNVIDGSYYSWEPGFDNQPMDNDCLKLASELSQNWWHHDLVYTLDIASTDEGPKMIELNSFSSSGLYHCDREKIMVNIYILSISILIH